MPNKSDAAIIRPSLISFPNFLNSIIRIDISIKFKNDSNNLLSIVCVKTSIVFFEMRKNANPIRRNKKVNK